MAIYYSSNYSALNRYLFPIHRDVFSQSGILVILISLSKYIQGNLCMLPDCLVLLFLKFLAKLLLFVLYKLNLYFILFSLSNPK